MRWIVQIQIQNKFEEGGHWTTERPCLFHANLYHRVHHCVLWPCRIVRPLCCLGQPSPNGMTIVTVTTRNCLQMAMPHVMRPHLDLKYGWAFVNMATTVPSPCHSGFSPFRPLSLCLPLPHCAPSCYRQNQRTKGLASGLTRSPWTYWTHNYWQVAKMDDTVSDTERLTFKQFNNYSRCHVMRKECSGMSSVHWDRMLTDSPTHCQLVV